MDDLGVPLLFGNTHGTLVKASVLTGGGKIFTGRVAVFSVGRKKDSGGGS